MLGLDRIEDNSYKESLMHIKKWVNLTLDFMRLRGYVYVRRDSKASHIKLKEELLISTKS